MQHLPNPGSSILKWAGDSLTITLNIGKERAGQAVFRTNIGGAAVRRAEIRAATENGTPPLAQDWQDIPMLTKGGGLYTITVPLDEVGIFAGKACFIPAGTYVPEWPDGDNLIIKVAPAHTAVSNGIYAAFVRLFREPIHTSPAVNTLDKSRYTVIPPSGTFRSFAKHLPHIVDALGFRNVLLLPVHPTPTTYAKMGRYGSPFAATDFYSIDPALAEFDTAATPMEQFCELVGQVHARGARLLMDIPANHTGWAATLQTHHPEWYKRNADHSYHSPGAWGVTWEDLVELDYSHPQLREFIADVFLFWCGKGVDGFRCDAGYMIPVETWTYVVARVRENFPDTVFLLEGLGGHLTTTNALLNISGLDWAYSELFQTYDRAAMERELPDIFSRSERFGALVHFAETHDNNRLAASGKVWAQMRVKLSALLSQQGAWGITSGVEWLAAEKIDVHGFSSLNWNAPDNLNAEIARLNHLLATHPAFGPGATLKMVQVDGGNTLVVLRQSPGANLLILVNLDPHNPQPATWRGVFNREQTTDLLTGRTITLPPHRMMLLQPGEVLCLGDEVIPQSKALPADCSPRLHKAGIQTVRCDLPADSRRVIPLPHGHQLEVRATTPFRAMWKQGSHLRAAGQGELDDSGSYCLCVAPPPQESALAVRMVHHAGRQTPPLELQAEVYQDGAAKQFTLTIYRCPAAEPHVQTLFSGAEVRTNPTFRTLLTNGAGAMSQVRLAWSEIRSQYDALLAANLNDQIPVDRTVLWTRCRAWLRFCGYSAEINAACLDTFQADPEGRFARWNFLVPCGMGKQVPITFLLELEEGKNCARLTVCRTVSQANGIGKKKPVQIILRPDIEWRSFHAKTKAFAGPEQHWPLAMRDTARGFTFAPYDGIGLRLDAARATWHREDAWVYCVGHPDDADRGLDGQSDLYSPGWFSADLNENDDAVLTASDLAVPVAKKTPAAELPQIVHSVPLEKALQQMLRNFIVRRDEHKTVIAGYPWFLDWGRDTLIAARGILADGQIDVVYDLLSEFGRFESQGMLPNIIHGTTVGNYDTVDAPLWYCRVVRELAEKKTVKSVLAHKCGNRTVKAIVASILQHYQSGTPNGIHVDAATGLVFAPPHFTWMDTNYPAGTPRQGYPVEIQALWLSALEFAAKHIDPGFKKLHKLAGDSFARLYPLPGGGLSDCLFAEPGASANHALKDDSIRPNQLFAVTFGLLDSKPELAQSVVQACACLLHPGSIRSLADKPVQVPLAVYRDGVLLNDPHNPYQGYYRGDEDTRRKPAYHNGTGWTWVFPSYAEALARVHGFSARTEARALLSSVIALTNQDCVCQIPENTDGDAPHAPRGCGAQAWGVSEFLRVWKLLKDPKPTRSKKPVTRKTK